MFRFLHAADLHLDTPFVGVGRVSEALGERLREASLVALDRLVEAALRYRVDFVVLSGDLYDGAERGVRAQMRFLGALERLSAAEILVFVAHGNHDPVMEGWSAIRAWPEGVHVFGADEVEVHRLQIRGELVTVSGISYGRRDVSENLALRFEGPTGADAREGFHVAVLHANVGSAAEHAAYSPCVLSDLVGRGYDYWALGHIHKRQVLREARPFVGYPGNTQGRSFKASECGAKGAWVVQVEGGAVAVEFVELGPVRFVEVEVSAAGLEDMGAVVSGLMEAAGRQVAGARGEVEVVARARIVGRTALYGDFMRAGVAGELLEALQDRGREIEGLWWAGVRVEVEPERGLEAFRGREDLLGSVAGLGAAWGEDVERLREILGAERALGNRVHEWSDEALRALVRRASALAIDLIE